MIQDIAPHTYHNEYRPVPPKEDSFLLYFEERKALAAWDTPELAFPRFQDYPEVERRLSDRVIYLFSIDDQNFYLVKELQAPERKSLPSGQHPEFQVSCAPVAFFRRHYGISALALV